MNLIQELLALNENSNTDAVTAQFAKFAKAVKSDRLYTVFDEEEMNRYGDGDDIKIIEYFLKNKIEGASAVTIKKTQDDGMTGYSFTFKVNSTKYGGTYWSEGDAYCFITPEPRWVKRLESTLASMYSDMEAHKDEPASVMKSFKAFADLVKEREGHAASVLFADEIKGKDAKAWKSILADIKYSMKDVTGERDLEDLLLSIM